MQIEEILYTQGFGTRRVCAGLVQQGYVSVSGATVTDPGADFDAEDLRFTVQGVDWQYHEKAYLMLNKPAGTECSQKPSTYPSIYTLLPSPCGCGLTRVRSRACRRSDGWTRTPQDCCS